MARQLFATSDVLRLEVEQASNDGLRNLVPNPSGGLGAWGWLRPVPDTAITTTEVNGVTWLAFAPVYPPNSTTPAYYYTTESFSVAAGMWVAARWQQAGDVGGAVEYASATLEWLAADGTVISSTGLTSLTRNTAAEDGGFLQTTAAKRAPSGTVRARLRYDMSGNLNADGGPGGAPSGQLYLRDVTAAKAADPSDLVSDTTELPLLPTQWVDILGATHSITLKRSELNVGVLTADVPDATLDPSQSNLIRPGRRVRLMAFSGGKWGPIGTGKVSNGRTSYDPKARGDRQVRVTLSSLDAVTQLSGTPCGFGVGYPYGLPKVLEGAGVPWSINGSSDYALAGGQSYIVSITDNTSVLDQVGITRDSRLAFAWVDRRGVLNVWDRDVISVTPVAVLDESTYSDIALDYDTDRCINVVNIKARETDADGKNVEVAYGPYINQDSVDEWGPHSATFTVQGLTAAGMADYAAAILAANSTPAVRINSVTLPVLTTADLELVAMRDLYDMVTVRNAAAGIDQAMRVTSVEHTITAGQSPTDCRWLVKLGFTVANSVASPQASPGLSGGVNATPGTGAERLVQAGDVVVTTNGNARGEVAFPETFDVAPVVVAMGGNGESITTVEGGDGTPTSTTTGFAFYAFNQAGAPMTNSGVRVRYIATRPGAD